jgi:hypothetical protein
MQKGIFQKGIAVGLGISKSGEEKDVECLNSKSPLEFNTWNIPKLRKKAICFQKHCYRRKYRSSVESGAYE